MEYNIIKDNAVCEINAGESKDKSKAIKYRDESGSLLTIDLETCAGNFSKEHDNSSGRCIGERSVQEWCFILYTSGVKTKIEFKKLFVGNLFKSHLLVGNRSARFHKLQKLIGLAGYHTFDMT